MAVLEESGFHSQHVGSHCEFGLGRAVISSFSRTFAGCSVVTPASRTPPGLSWLRPTSPHLLFLLSVPLLV